MKATWEFFMKRNHVSPKGLEPAKTLIDESYIESFKDS